MPIEQNLREEPAEWTNLANETSNLISKLQSDFEAEIDDFNSILPELQEIAADTGPALHESINTATNELHDEFQSVVEEVVNSFERLKSAAEELEETFTDRLPETMEMATERITATFEEAKESVENDFIKKVTEDVEDQLDLTEEKIESATDKLRTDFQELIEETVQQADELLETLGQFGSMWTDKVDEVKQEYESIVTRVNEVGRQVRVLADAMDDALATSGVGMNAASSVLGDIKTVLDNVI